MTDNQTAKCREFTLLHLSGLFVILGIVLAIGRPPTVVTPSRRVERDVDICAYNLHMIGLSLRLYAEENGGRCPVDADPPTLAGSLQLLSNTWESAHYLQCPGDHRAGAQRVHDFSNLTAANISYAYVPNLRWNDPKAISIIVIDRIDTKEKGDRWPSHGNHGSRGGNVLYTNGRIEFLENLPPIPRDSRRPILNP